MLNVRDAVSGDAGAIEELMVELDHFYGDTPTDTRQTRSERISTIVLGDGVQVAVAELDGVMVGLASFSFLWPAAGVTSSVFLKELYVRSSHRRHGIGRALMDHLAAVADKAGCSRVEWTTETGNNEARTFYASLGAAPVPEKIFYRWPVPRE